MLVALIIVSVLLVAIGLLLLNCHGQVQGFKQEMQHAGDTIERLNAALLENGVLNKRLLRDLEQAHAETERHVKEIASFQCRIEKIEKVVHPLTKAEIKHIVDNIPETADPKGILPPCDSSQ